MKPALFFFLMTAIVLSACGPAPAAPTDLPTRTPTPGTPHRAPGTWNLTPAPTQTVTPSPQPTSTPSPSPSPSPVPTYAILRGKVNVERASCRYGPGPMYLYLYGLAQGATQDVIGRTDSGAWLLTQARGDTTRCWVKADLMDLNGDVLGVEVVYPDKYILPVSPYYTAPWDAAATRSGDQVTITWKSQPLRAGDEESPSMVIYIVEVWTCENGQVTFKPIGTSYAQVTVTDQPGCSQPSHGRIFFQEKHGFAGPAAIPWP